MQRNNDDKSVNWKKLLLESMWLAVGDMDEYVKKHLKI